MRFLSIILLSLFFAVNSYSSPNILSIGNEENLGAGRIASIATDTLNQPHIVADGGSWVYMYDKIGSEWRTLHKDAKTIMGSDQYYNPHIEIDALNRAWYSGVLINGGHGIGLIVRENISDNPSDYTTMSRVRIARVFDVGLLSLDPNKPNEGFIASTDGKWKQYIYDPTLPSKTREGTSGQLYAGNGGEKTGFTISEHDGVWHMVSGGYVRSPSGYQNSIRKLKGLPHLIWANYENYPTQEDDGTYVRVVGDKANPEYAYITCDFSTGGKYRNTAGVAINIWNGENFNFDSSSILSLDPLGSSGMRRFSAQSYPAKNGGVFVTWTRGNQVKIRYVPPFAKSIEDCGEEWNITKGTRPTLCVDNNGDIHLVYSEGNSLKYRFIQMDAFSQFVSSPIDANSDGIDDLALYISNKWKIITLDNTNIIESSIKGDFVSTSADFGGENQSVFVLYDSSKSEFNIVDTQGLLISNFVFGSPNSFIPIEDYNNDGVDDISVYNRREWQAIDYRSKKRIFYEKVESGIPVTGDYDGDGRADIAIYDNGNWNILNPYRYIFEDFNWGFEAAQIFASDFNGDGKSDLTVYHEGKWYVNSTSEDIIMWKFQHGYNNTFAVPEDYNGDGKDDMAIYDNNAGRWYIIETNRNIIIWNERWGYRDALPVSGDFNGDGSGDLAVYDIYQNKWYIKTINNEILSWGVQHPRGYTIAVSGDYDGDGRDDLCSYNPELGLWHITDTDGKKIISVSWGFKGCVPFSGDFDNDGRADFNLYYPEGKKWYSININMKVLINRDYNGDNKMHPISGDFNGDGKDDLCLFGNGKWTSWEIGGPILKDFNWGFKGVVPVSGDYDGDGKDDLCVYYDANGNWYIHSGETIPWGFKGTTPISGDYDGDGISDLTVHDEHGNIYILSKKSGEILRWAYKFGIGQVLGGGNH